MMRVVFGLLIALCVSQALADTSTLEEARSHAMLLGKSLKNELVAAMKSGGPLTAISLCNARAMPISQEVSSRTGWQVGRTSLLVRNPENTADAWENQQLKMFEQRLAAGEPAEQIEVLEVSTEGHTTRYMKAIVIEEACLACHGEAIAPVLSEQLYSLYPEDKARGYRLGQLRGALSLQRDHTSTK